MDSNSPDLYLIKLKKECNILLSINAKVIFINFIGSKTARAKSLYFLRLNSLNSKRLINNINKELYSNLLK